MSTFVKYLALSIAFSCLPMGSQSVQATNQPFLVNQATYSGKDGAFRCEAKLAAGDDATLTVKIPTTDVKDVQGSIHTSLPAKISSSVSGTDTIISIVISSDRATNAGVTFKNKIADSFKISYGIELECDELHGYVQVFDRSGTNANWSNARLRIVLPSGDICVTATMDHSQSSTLPVKSLAKYPISLNEKSDHFRTQANQAFEIQDLSNLGKATLLPGDLRVMQKGVLQYSSALRGILPPQQTAELLGKPVDAKEISVKSSVQGDRWSQADSITNGILSYTPWKVTNAKIKNNRDIKEPLATVYIENSKNSYSLKSGAELQTIERIEEVKPVGDQTFVANLFDLSETSLKLHITRLQEFEYPLSKVSKDGIDRIRSALEKILAATRTLTPLTAGKKVVDNLLKGPEECREELAVQLTRIEEGIRTTQCDQMNATKDLVSELFANLPLPTNLDPNP